MGQLVNPFKDRYGHRRNFFSGRITPGIITSEEPLFDDEDDEYYEEDDSFYDPTIIYMGRLTPHEVQPSSII